MRSVISDAHVAGNDGFKIYSAACGRRNSLQEGFLISPSVYQGAFFCPPLTKKGGESMICKEYKEGIFP